MASIIQSWVTELGLRHQGVLISAVRGPDGIERDDPIKTLIRMFRGAILTAHCNDITKAVSYMIPHDPDLFEETGKKILKSIDHYNLHFFLHFVHAIEIMGYYSPNNRVQWLGLYLLICKKMHIKSEAKTDLDERLNADEETFGRQQEA